VLEVGVFKGGNVKADQPKLIASHLLAVLESEIPATTAVFSALPPRRLDYRPDQTSKSALALMRHIVLEDEWFLRAIADGKFSPPPDDSDACGLLTPVQAVEFYKTAMPAAIARVRQLSDEDLNKTLDLMGAFQLPAIQFLSLMVRHSVHHRGQLSAYIRSMGGKVPAIYGPSADTQIAAAASVQA
jgi:uncharacterized damage-inducible protein DinB